MHSGIVSGEPPEAKVMKGGKRPYPDHVTALKPTSKERRPFIVADMETVLIKNSFGPFPTSLPIFPFFPGKHS